MISQYAAENNLEKIVELLLAKGSTILGMYETDEITNVTNKNIDFPVLDGEICDMKVIEIFSDTGISDKTRNIFSKEIEILDQIANLERALYVFISPHSIIPAHCDDDDLSFRIITGVLTPSSDVAQIGLVIDNDPALNLKVNQTIGIAAPVIWHHGWNRTDKFWSVLTLCVKDKTFDGIRKIY
jgi:hypothetical protein